VPVELDDAVGAVVADHEQKHRAVQRAFAGAAKQVGSLGDTFVEPVSKAVVRLLAV